MMLGPRDNDGFEADVGIPTSDGAIVRITTVRGADETGARFVLTGDVAKLKGGPDDMVPLGVTPGGKTLTDSDVKLLTAGIPETSRAEVEQLLARLTVDKLRNAMHEMIQGALTIADGLEKTGHPADLRKAELLRQRARELFAKAMGKFSHGLLQEAIDLVYEAGNTESVTERDPVAIAKTA